MKRFLLVSLALVGVMTATPSAHANPLSPGGTVAPDTFALPGFTFVDQWSASLTALNGPSPGITQTIFGTYQEWVYRNNTTGTLAFFEQVNSSTSSTTTVNRITVSTYSGFATDVGYLADVSGVPPTGNLGGTLPTTVDRSANGATLGFNFATPINANQSSAVLVIQTDATTYDRNGTLSAIDGTTSSNLTFQPTVVPEPSTMAIAGLGALGMIGYGLRRRKALGA